MFLRVRHFWKREANPAAKTPTRRGTIVKSVEKSSLRPGTCESIVSRIPARGRTYVIIAARVLCCPMYCKSTCANAKRTIQAALVRDPMPPEPPTTPRPKIPMLVVVDLPDLLSAYPTDPLALNQPLVF